MPNFLSNVTKKINRRINDPLSKVTGSISAGRLRSYFSDKTIQTNFRFYVTILDRSIIGLNDPNLYARTGPMPEIQDWHVTNVSLPLYDFKKENMTYGPIPRTYPYLEYDGLELKIDFEEDENGTIGYFVNWLTRRIIDRDGTYTPPGQVKLDRIIVETHDKNSVPVALFTFHNCYYLQATVTDYAYNGSESVKYSITFNSDFMNSYFPKKIIDNGVNKAVGSVVGGAIGGIRRGLGF